MSWIYLFLWYVSGVFGVCLFWFIDDSWTVLKVKHILVCIFIALLGPIMWLAVVISLISKFNWDRKIYTRPPKYKGY